MKLAVGSAWVADFCVVPWVTLGDHGDAPIEELANCGEGMIDTASFAFLDEFINHIDDVASRDRR